MIKKLETYIKNVSTAKITVGKFERLAVERFQRDLTREDLLFEEKEVNRVLRFFKLLHHTTGRWKGKVFNPEGWQVFILANLFGFRKSNGMRRFNTAFISVGRKNGKSCLAAAVGLYSLISDGEARAEVYSAATKKDQAKIVFSEACRMVATSAELRRFVKVLTGSITVPESYSKFEALGADTDTLDGLNIHCALIDEIHAHKDRRLWDVLQTATGARENPLLLAITTAGFDKQSFCWNLQEYGQNILEGSMQDDTFFSFICTLDDGDDYLDEKTWRKSNPNLGTTVTVEDLRDEANRVKNDPQSLNAFLRYRMNQWTASESAWITAEKWDACNLGHIDISTLQGRECVAALDLAAKRDTTSLVLVFPPVEPEAVYVVLPYVFIPEATIFERERKERVPWVMWHRQGHVLTAKGEVTDFREILIKLKELDAIFKIGDLCFDPWGMDLVIPFLKEMNWSDDPEDKKAKRFLIEFRQGYKSMSPAIKLVEEMVLTKRVNHGGHPCLAWMASCCMVTTDPALNAKLDKAKSAGHIDAVVAMAMALYHAKTFKPAKKVSKYERDGLLIL